jgi:glutaminyl-tRNA synthetase
MFDEGTWTLRLKMDFSSSNPNLYDLVAYRIKYTAHPHNAGWCMYPSYDFTHGICDSLERIDYSICTLEFETRREPYYWILWALDMFRPNVYEMSRLNLQYTVLSKRRLLKLVEQHVVRGWDDPRMPTISGLRRRGYTKEIINTFCNDLGATRASNVIEMEKLYNTARTCLAKTSQRAMAALDPIEITISNWAEHANTTLTFDVQNVATDPSLGTHAITLTSTLYIDASDFRLEDDPQYYGLAPNKAVGLKYHGGNLICDEVKRDAVTNKVVALICRLDSSEDRPKPKTHLSWVPSNGIPCHVRVYNHLFSVPEPSDLWEEELNTKTSEIVFVNAIVDPSVASIVDYRTVDKWNNNTAFQFERMGYFVVDLDTTPQNNNDAGLLVFNRTVSLKEEVFKQKRSKQEEDINAARKAKQAADLAAKEVRMTIDPMDLFKVGDEYQGKYSQYDDTTGLPTHAAADADGNSTALTKSAIKKLAKEQQKHVNALAKWKKASK